MNPLLSEIGTLVCVTTYFVAFRLYGRCGKPALLNPVFLSVFTLCLILLLGNFDVQTFQNKSELLLLLLPICVCALSMPIYRQRREIVRQARALFFSVVGVTLFSSVSVALIGFLLHKTQERFVSALIPKSITAPVAQEIAFAMGADFSLGGAVAISTGICGAVFGSLLLKRFAPQHAAIGGIAIGASSHGIATAQLFAEKHQVAGTYAGLAMALCALFGAIIIPFLWLGLKLILFG